MLRGEQFSNCFSISKYEMTTAKFKSKITRLWKYSSMRVENTLQIHEKGSERSDWIKPKWEGKLFQISNVSPPRAAFSSALVRARSVTLYKQTAALVTRRPPRLSQCRQFVESEEKLHGVVTLSEHFLGISLHKWRWGGWVGLMRRGSEIKSIWWVFKSNVLL